jgi:hypothetical protein
MLKAERRCWEIWCNQSVRRDYAFEVRKSWMGYRCQLIGTLDSLGTIDSKTGDLIWTSKERGFRSSISQSHFTFAGLPTRSSSEHELTKPSCEVLQPFPSREYREFSWIIFLPLSELLVVCLFSWRPSNFTRSTPQVLSWRQFCFSSWAISCSDDAPNRGPSLLRIILCLEQSTCLPYTPSCRISSTCSYE